MGPKLRFERLPNCPPPAFLAARLAHRDRAFFLDSSMANGGMGRFSFTGSDPSAVFTAKGNNLALNTGGRTRRWRGDALAALDELIELRRKEPGDYPVPFAGGGVGFISYDFGRTLERIPSSALDDLHTPDLMFAFYDTVVAYDLEAHEAYLVHSNEDSTQILRRMLTETESPSPDEIGPLNGQHSGTFSRDSYLAAVAEIKRSIRNGYVYQVNLSQRFEMPWPHSAWSLYERVRTYNPAPMSAYLDCGSLSIVSASPERFLRQTGPRLETRPIKGTRPRGLTADVDRQLGEELVKSSKDRAEHIMIVDLERNDLGRIAEVGSVQVTNMMSLESFPSVHHLTSTVTATALRHATPGSILRATFPGGSITGAPKIKAMEMIEHLEPTRRGVYTGAIGYLSDTGDFDLNIAIRTILVKSGRAFLQVGGGIVADSDPEAEYQETLDKGRSLFAALSGSNPIAAPIEPALQY